jgi:hypothetical protein
MASPPRLPSLKRLSAICGECPAANFHRHAAVGILNVRNRRRSRSVRTAGRCRVYFGRDPGVRGQFARHQSRAAHGRFGSKADIASRPPHVRFTAESGHCRAALGCPLCATCRHGSVDAALPMQYGIEKDAIADKDNIQSGVVRNVAFRA